MLILDYRLSCIRKIEEDEVGFLTPEKYVPVIESDFNWQNRPRKPLKTLTSKIIKGGKNGKCVRN